MRHARRITWQTPELGQGAIHAAKPEKVGCFFVYRRTFQNIGVPIEPVFLFVTIFVTH